MYRPASWIVPATLLLNGRIAQQRMSWNAFLLCVDHEKGDAFLCRPRRGTLPSHPSSRHGHAMATPPWVSRRWTKPNSLLSWHVLKPWRRWMIGSAHSFGGSVPCTSVRRPAIGGPQAGWARRKRGIVLRRPSSDCLRSETKTKRLAFPFCSAPKTSWSTWKIPQWAALVSISDFF